MMLARLFQRYAVVLLALGLALLTGCTDRLLTETPSDDAPAASESKLRYAHLLASHRSEAMPAGAKRILERYEDLSTDTDFIVGMDADTELEPLRVLERYRILERYNGLNGVTVKRSFKDVYPGFSVYVKKNALSDFLEEIETDSDIEWVEPDPTIKFKKSSPGAGKDDNEYLPWGVDQIDAELFTQIGDDDDDAALGDYTQQTHVFVLDSGITSPDVNVCEVRTFLENDSTDDADTVGHGTHVAGTIGAKHNNGGVLGVAPNVCLHDYRVMDDNGKTKLSTVVDAVDHITALKQEHPDWPMIVNISLGADVGATQYNALDEAVQASIDAGVVYVIAAGNDGIDASTVTPAHVADAITVAAHDADAHFAGFSNHGSLIDIAAPGVDIASLPSAAVRDSELAWRSGTSSAAAHVSGAAALYLALKNPYATPSEVRDQLRSYSGHFVSGAPEATTTTRLHLEGLLNELDDDLWDDDLFQSDDDDD